MKLKDLITVVGNHAHWIKFSNDWVITDNGNISLTIPAEVNIDDEIEIYYLWFHHLMPNLNKEEIWKAIEEHNYGVWYQWFLRLLPKQLVYLPSHALIMKGEEQIGTIFVADSPDVFSLITFQDCECG